jgi:hypothetical protein
MEIGDTKTAMAAAQKAVLLEAHLADYIWLEHNFEEQVPEVRLKLIRQSRDPNFFNYSGICSILIYEEMVREAFEIAKRHKDYSDMLNAVQAAVTIDPEFARSAALEEALETIGRSLAKYYHHAIRWLLLAKQAMRNLRREKEWDQLLASLLYEHRYKTSLVRLLEELQQEQTEHPL